MSVPEVGVRAPVPVVSPPVRPAAHGGPGPGPAW
jgi:hypothetical protein